MTNKEAVLAESGVNVPQNVLDKLFEDSNLNALEEYTPDNAKQVASLAIDVLLRSSYYSSISEGGYSVSYDKKYIDNLLKLLAFKAGRPDVIDLVQGTPKIKAIRRW